MTNAGINGFAVEFYHSIKKELTSTFLKLFYKKKKSVWEKAYYQTHFIKTL